MGTRETVTFAQVLIIDDHPLFCDALAMTLRSTGIVGQVATVNTLQAALDRLRTKHDVDIVFLDLNLPNVTGLDGLVKIRNTVADTPILVVSSMSDNRMINAIQRAGARGFVPKHSGREAFHRAITMIAENETYWPDGFVEVPENTAETDENSDAIERLSTLTNQQAKILDLICEGKLNKQIAFDLSIAEATVKAHVTAIMRKLGVQSRTQAVLLASKTRFSNLLASESNGP